MEEEWRPVVGFESYYEVSNTGRVRSLDTYTSFIMNGRNIVKFIRGRELIPLKGKNGYFTISLHMNGNMRRVPIHRLVAEAFLPNPENKRTVNHKNGIKTDNNLENLEWATDSENILHAVRTGLMNVRKRILQIKNGVVINEYESIKDAGNAIIEEYKKLGFPISHRAHKNISGAAIKGTYAYGYQWKQKEKDS